MNNSSGFNGALAGAGQGIAQVGMLMMEDNLAQHREQRLAALKQQADDKNYTRERGDKEKDYARDRGDKLADAETQHGYAKDLLQTKAAAEGKLDQMSNADREKARLKALNDLNVEYREDSKNGMPWEDGKYAESQAAIERLYGPRNTTQSDVDPDRVSAAAQAIQNKLAGKQGTTANKGLIDGVEPKASKPEAKGLITAEAPEQGESGIAKVKGWLNDKSARGDAANTAKLKKVIDHLNKNGTEGLTRGDIIQVLGNEGLSPADRNQLNRFLNKM